MSTTRTIRRRAALATTLGLFALAGVAASRASSLNATPVPAGPVADTIGGSATIKEPSNRWLKGLKAKNRQFFDAPSPAGGIPLVHVMNYYDTYNKAFGVKDSEINAVLTFYGATTFYALSDAAWAKYRLGEFLETNDPATGKPATSNPWRSAPSILGMTLEAASMESLHKRGATLILCNNALEIFAGLLAAKRGLDPAAVYRDLNANILPQVELVPAMVIAVEQATRAGLTYHRQ
jgi:hypothetical protein